VCPARDPIEPGGDEDCTALAAARERCLEAQAPVVLAAGDVGSEQLSKAPYSGPLRASATLRQETGEASMDIIIRSATDEDADIGGRICYESFRAINERHGTLPEYGSLPKQNSQRYKPRSTTYAYCATTGDAVIPQIRTCRRPPHPGSTTGKRRLILRCQNLGLGQEETRGPAKGTIT
jgi:hypothetical protein